MEDIRHRQEHIEFLENYITELTEKIDELTDGRDLQKMIRSLEFRIEVLKRSDGMFPNRTKELESELQILVSEFKRVEPIIEKLETERAFYRQVQSEM